MDNTYTVQITPNTRLIREGWTHVGTRIHYVKDGLSQCGRWWTPAEFPDDSGCPVEDRCWNCVRSRAKVERGGTRLRKQIRNRKERQNGQQQRP